MIGAAVFRSATKALLALAASSGASLVGFLQSGTGATARTVQDKGRERVSAADYGVTAGGTAAANATALQAAIDALYAAGGGDLEIDFAFQSNAITLKTNVRLRGKPGATFTYPAANVADAITVAAGHSNVAVVGLTFDLQSNANGVQAVNLGGVNGALIEGNTFLNGAVRPFLRADWAAAGGGNVTVRNNTFRSNAAGGAIWFLATAAGTENICIEGNTFDNIGGSICKVVASVAVYPNQYDYFSNTRYAGNRVLNCNAGGAFGPIPLELWGHTNVAVVGNVMDSGTRGIGFSSVKNGVIASNVVENQSLYFAEIGTSDGVTVVGNTAKNCKIFIQDGGGAADIGDLNMQIVGNTCIGTGLAANDVTKDYISTAAGGVRKGWQIRGNLFVDIGFLRSIVRVVGVASDFVIEGNTFIANEETSCIEAITVREGSNVYVCRNKYLRRANVTAATPMYNNGSCVFGASNNTGGSGIFIEENTVDSSGTIDAGAFLFGVGNPSSGAAALAQFRVNRNRLRGNFSTPINISSNSGDTESFDNAFRAATGVNNFNAAVVFRRERFYAEGNAAPTTGAWVRGDYVRNWTQAVGSPRGWTCTASGTPGTWTSDGNV